VKTCKDIPWIVDHCQRCHDWLDTHDAILNLGKHERGQVSCCCKAYDLLYPGSDPIGLCAGMVVKIVGEPEVYTSKQY